MTTIITYKLFSSRTGSYGHCFMTVDTYVMRGTKILGSSQAVMHGDNKYHCEDILRKLREFLHEDDNGASRDVWTSNDIAGTILTVEKVWYE